jgi:hypothetical protein
MMSTFDPTLALTLLTHPFQVVLVAVTFGALVRHGIFAWTEGHPRVMNLTTIQDVDFRAAA